MVLRGATSLRGALEGVGPENRDSFGPSGDWNFVSWIELIADPHHRDADLDLAFHYDANPDPDPTFQFDADPDPTTHFSPYLDPKMFLKDPLRLPPFHFDADPGPDPAQNDADLRSTVVPSMRGTYGLRWPVGQNMKF